MGFYIIFYTNVMSGLPLLCTDLRFGLPRASSPLQSPICHSCSLLLDFLLPLLRFKVQSSDISRSFWTSSCLSSASKSNPQPFLAPFGLPRISPLPQSPFLHSFSLLLDFRVPPLRLKVHSATLPLPTTQKRRIAKQSASPILHQPIPPSKAPAISATSESGTRTYLPSGTNHFPTGLSAPALTASTANFFPATQKNIIAASIAPSGQI